MNESQWTSHGTNIHPTNSLWKRAKINIHRKQVHGNIFRFLFMNVSETLGHFPFCLFYILLVFHIKSKKNTLKFVGYMM